MIYLQHLVSYTKRNNCLEQNITNYVTFEMFDLGLNKEKNFRKK